MASIAAAIVLVRRLPRPKPLLDASAGASAIAVLMLLQATFEYSTMPLRYLVMAWHIL